MGKSASHLLAVKAAALILMRLISQHRWQRCGRVRPTTQQVWLAQQKGLTVDPTVPQRSGKYGTAFARRDKRGVRWAVKMLSNDHMDCAQPVEGFLRTGNDLWVEDCRQQAQRATEEGVEQPPRSIVRVAETYHIPMPPHAQGHHLQGVTAYRMEWIDRTLADLTGPLPDAQLAGIVRDVVDAVHYLGLRGLIHGDIHHKNIVVRGGGGAALEGVLIDLDRLHRQDGDRLYIPNQANSAFEPEALLSHSADMQAATW
ncbi:unnamed protein product [Vitrella brassicaformis CCMP3155]|uniref:Protein kinase domain-containing protein n=1 Tax=Vitrella brassicaformis (strain CCMP3155) TaxID=1169540 RepID=A0A0G4G2E0_VITBC|nr:unnamed protein product [Vitrella brassicaformis CCMP3155]|eukprot:CEM22003.1 unnamed protein product [Vitrella brassicaformis CCMP3155]